MCAKKKCNKSTHHCTPPDRSMSTHRTKKHRSPRSEPNTFHQSQLYHLSLYRASCVVTLLGLTVSTHSFKSLSLSLSLSLSTINGRLRNPPPPPPPSNPKRNSLPGSEHHNPAPLREDPREKALHRPPKEGAPQALPAILHLLGPCLLGPGSVPSPPVPPLLGTHHTPLALPPDLLRFSGANPEVHQWVQVPEALPQAHAWAGHWEAEGDEDKSQWCCRRWWPLWRCWWRWIWDSLPRASWELLWQVQEELGFAFWLLDLDLWIYGLILCCPPLFLAVRFFFLEIDLVSIH